jgi:hypothetical protein
VWLEGLGKFENSPHRVSNPLPSGLWHSALTTTPHFVCETLCRVSYTEIYLAHLTVPVHIVYGT